MTSSREAFQQFFFFAWTLVHPAEEQMPLVPLSFFTALSWTYAFFPISPMLMESALAARWKLRASFVNVRELLWHELHLLSLSWKAQPDPPGQRGKLYSSFESMSLFKEAFLPWAHVPAGSFLQGLSWKMGPQGQAQKYCKIFPLFLWKTALTRKYSDSLCSQRLQKPARSSFLTRFFLFVCLILKCTFLSRTVSHLLEHQQSQQKASREDKQSLDTRSQEYQALVTGLSTGHTSSQKAVLLHWCRLKRSN